MRLAQRLRMAGFKPSAPPVGNGMVLEVEILAGSLGFEIGCYSTSDEYNAEIAWGDGTTSTITSDSDADLAHTYSSAGTYTVEITGTFPNISMEDLKTVMDSQLKIKKVLNLGVLGFTRLSSAFIDCGITDFTSGTTDISGVDSLNSFLYGNESLENVDLTGLDTSQVTSFKSMFRTCSLLKPFDMSMLDTSNVEDLEAMFKGCDAMTSIDISNWDTSKVIEIAYFLESCPAFTTRTGLADINIGSIETGSSMLTYSGITTAEYDELLVNWQGQPHQLDVNVSFGDSYYTGGSAAEAARQSLIDNDGWTIADDGPI